MIFYDIISKSEIISIWCGAGMGIRKDTVKDTNCARSKNRPFLELRKSCADLRSMPRVVVYHRTTLRMFKRRSNNILYLSEKKISFLCTISQISSQFSDLLSRSLLKTSIGFWGGRSYWWGKLNEATTGKYYNQNFSLQGPLDQQ